MAKWVFLLKLTDSGAAKIDSLEALVAGRGLEWAELSGSEFTECCLTMGEYDVVAVGEGSVDAAAAFALLQARHGLFRTTTMQGLAVSEAPRLMGFVKERHDPF